MPRGGRLTLITANVRLDDGRAPPEVPPGPCVRLEVEDTGCGIAAGELDKVFTPFEQAGSGRQKIGGTGLGIPISRQFARLMGGDLILLRSEPGVGSLFRFTFQAEVLETAACMQTATDERCVRRVATDEKEWRVLVVDDQETNRSLLSQVLVQAGFTVREAGDGSDAIARFLAWHPDIVLMDIQMPEMDGYEATRRIKASAPGSATPVIAITASVMMEERQKALDHGFDGFIMKPVQMQELFEEIRRLTNVAYLYEEIPSGGDTVAEAAPLTAGSLASLPGELLAAMRDTLDAGDTAALRGLIGRVGESEPTVATELCRLVDTYAYGTLAALFTGEERTHASA
jgi:CheY-like chemotaxis protein